jgi:hypothetical protein
LNLNSIGPNLCLLILFVLAAYSPLSGFNGHNS